MALLRWLLSQQNNTPRTQRAVDFDLAAGDGPVGWPTATVWRIAKPFRHSCWSKFAVAGRRYRFQLQPRSYGGQAFAYTLMAGLRSCVEGRARDRLAGSLVICPARPTGRVWLWVFWPQIDSKEENPDRVHRWWRDTAEFPFSARYAWLVGSIHRHHWRRQFPCSNFFFFFICTRV